MYRNPAKPPDPGLMPDEQLVRHAIHGRQSAEEELVARMNVRFGNDAQAAVEYVKGLMK